MTHRSILLVLKPHSLYSMIPQSSDGNANDLNLAIAAKSSSSNERNIVGASIILKSNPTL